MSSLEVLWLWQPTYSHSGRYCFWDANWQSSRSRSVACCIRLAGDAMLVGTIPATHLTGPGVPSKLFWAWGRSLSARAFPTLARVIRSSRLVDPPLAPRPLKKRSYCNLSKKLNLSVAFVPAFDDILLLERNETVKQGHIRASL